MSLAWCNRYVGIPYKPQGRDEAGIDCWGLPMLVYRNERGIELPEFAGEYSDKIEAAEIARISRRELGSGRWAEVSEPRMFDLLGFKVSDFESHVGIWIAPGEMLHAVNGDCVKIERFDRGAWSRRLIGTYRWVG
ncbi:hypothetical protein BZU93_27680 [Salmonella enterica subsp. enterica]|nr:hypothetical protein [Salmonella enterica subsp. enterica serovar Enteritidis]